MDAWWKTDSAVSHWGFEFFTNNRPTKQFECLIFFRGFSNDQRGSELQKAPWGFLAKAKMNLGVASDITPCS